LEAPSARVTLHRYPQASRVRGVELLVMSHRIGSPKRRGMGLSSVGEGGGSPLAGLGGSGLRGRNTTPRGGAFVQGGPFSGGRVGSRSAKGVATPPHSATSGVHFHRAAPREPGSRALETTFVTAIASTDGTRKRISASTLAGSSFVESMKNAKDEFIQLVSVVAVCCFLSLSTGKSRCRPKNWRCAVAQQALPLALAVS
jgi:hypothetical protein